MSIINEYPRLCGGTFFTLLLEARRQRTKAREHRKGERDGLSNSDMLIGLIKVMNPDYDEPTKTTISTFKSNTSDFRACKISKGTYLPLDETEAFNKRVTDNYNIALQEMCRFVERFIDVGTSEEKDIRLVKALIELIATDQTIEKNQQFYSCEDGAVITREDIKSLTDICLQPFLLGIWHFILVNRKENSIGKTTFDLWCPPKGGGERTYEGNIGRGIMQKINVTLCNYPESANEKSSDDNKDGEPYIIDGEQQTDDRNNNNHTATSQNIITPAVFINYGTNATQISNQGTINIAGGKVKNEQ